MNTIKLVLSILDINYVIKVKHMNKLQLSRIINHEINFQYYLVYTF